MEDVFRLKEYLRYQWRAQTKYYIHSPFVYDLVMNVLGDTQYYYAYEQIEKLREELFAVDEQVEVKDFGALNSPGQVFMRSVREILRRSVKPPKYAQLLFRLVNHYGCAERLELGTSLGLTSLYLHEALHTGKLITLEGSEAVAAIAQKGFARFPGYPPQLITGPFEQMLPKALMQLERIDLVYFDGNHRKSPTLDYFKQCLDKAHNDSIFVFDDIYWSREMKEAWHQICAHEAVTVTVDLYFLGIVFFRKEQAKQDFVIRF